MRKMSILIIFVMMISILSSCKAQTPSDKSKNETPSDKTESIEKGLRVVNKDGYLNEYVSSTENMVLYKETINFSDAYKNIKYTEISNVKTPIPDMDLVALDNDGNVYYVKFVDPLINPGPTYIYRYSPFEKKWEKLVETDKKTQCTIISISDKYMIWQEDENANWFKANLNIYNLESKKNTKIYTYTRNTESGLMYSWQFNEPVIIDGKVYFEDTVGVDKENFYKIKIFSYDISSGKLTEVANDSKKVMEYKNKPAWLAMSEDKINCLFYADCEKGYLFKEITGLGTIFTSKGDMLVSNDYMTAADFEKIKEGTNETLGNNIISPTARRACYGIRKYERDKTVPIIAYCGDGGFIDSVKTNGNIVAWSGILTGLPMFYDNTLDKIVTFENYIDSKTTSYNMLLSDNYILVRSSVDMELPDDKITLLKLK